MKNINEIRDESKIDLKFDITTIENYALTIGALKNKYARYLQLYRLELKKQLLNLDLVYSERHAHFMHSSRLKIDRRDMDIHIKGNLEYRKASAAVSIAEEDVRYIDSIIKTFDNMSFTINSAIKLHIFQNGG